MISILYAAHFIPHFVYLKLIYTIINGVAELLATPSTCTLNEWNFFCSHKLLARVLGSGSECECHQSAQ